MQALTNKKSGELAQHKLFNEELMKQLQCIMLPARAKRCIKGFEYAYNATYILWKNGVKEGMCSLGLHEQASQLTSDEFLRHEEVFALFYQNQPVGLLLFDWMNLIKNFAILDHSYFNDYPKSLVQNLVRQGCENFMVISKLVVAKKWRKHCIGPGVSEILTGMMIRRFKQSKADVLLFLTRNDRGTNKLGIEYGAEVLLSNHQCYGANSDILAIYPDSVKNSSDAVIDATTEYLWQNRINAIINPLRVE